MVVEKRPLQSSSNTNTAAAMDGKTIEEMYQKKSQLEHILLRPDTYIGSIEKHTQTLWVFYFAFPRQSTYFSSCSLNLKSNFCSSDRNELEFKLGLVNY